MQKLASLGQSEPESGNQFDWAQLGLADFNVSLEKYLISALPGCGQNGTHTQSKGLNVLSVVGFHVKSRICEECNEEKKMLSEIRRLKCGHKICSECLHTRFKKKKFTCPIDGESIFGCFQRGSHQHK